MNNNTQGFTLIELITTITIAGILAALGVPNLQRTIQDNKMSSLYNELLGDLSFTRSTAITQGSTATFCKRNAAGNDCAAVSASWANGWLVFRDKNNDGVVDAGETILQEKTDVPKKMTILFSRDLSRISYNGAGYAFGFAGKFTFCDKRGESKKKGMVISQNGRVRVADSNDTLATCPTN